jgi:thiol-disulfide isomerase/thioredoxin
VTKSLNGTILAKLFETKKNPVSLNKMLNLFSQTNHRCRLQVSNGIKTKVDMTKFMRITSLFVLFITATLAVNAQSKHTISGHVDGLTDTTIFLANYYGNKLYYNDTTRIDHKGNFSFPGKPYKECGKYSIVLPTNNRFDIVVDEENIVIDFTADCKMENLKIKESKNNKIFYDYIKFISDKMKLRGPIDAVLADSTKTEAEKEPSRKQLKDMNDEVIRYQKDMIAKNPDLLVTKMIKMSMDVEVPEAPADSSEDGKKRWSYYYFRNHYWDNVDLKDPRLIREQTYHKLIERFVTQTLPQIPDTMTKAAKELLERVGNNEDGFKYIVHQFTYGFETSKIMCMDEGFVYMIDNYYSKGLCPWVKKEKLDEMKKAADEKRHCLCGEIGQNIILPDTSDHWKSMYDLKSKYTILVIWEATCGHCKKELPQLNELYKKWKPRGVEIFGVHNNLEVDKWKKFVRDEKLEFINVSRNQFIMTQDSATKLIYGNVTTLPSLNFHQYWDVNSTPKVYLMDKDHKIIAKSLGHDQLDDLLEKLESGGTMDEPMREHEFEDEDEEVSPDKTKVKPRNVPPPKQGTGGVKK